MSSLKGMRALVSGGAQGIGSNICLELASAGAAVAVLDIHLEAGKKVRAKIMERGGNSISICTDVVFKENCKQAVKSTVDELGGLDILVNCAAPARNKMMLGKLSDSDWEIHQQVVLNSAVFLADAASDYLAESGNGAIVNISSITGDSIAIDQCSWPYHVSKAGLNHLTRFLAVSLGRRGIRVNAIKPGLVDRDDGLKLSDDLVHQAVIKDTVPLGRAGTSQDIAQVVTWLCSKQSSYLTGQVITVDGGLSLNEVFGASLMAYKSGSNS